MSSLVQRLVLTTANLEGRLASRKAYSYNQYKNYKKIISVIISHGLFFSGAFFSEEVCYFRERFSYNSYYWGVRVAKIQPVVFSALI